MSSPRRSLRSGGRCVPEVMESKLARAHWLDSDLGISRRVRITPAIPPSIAVSSTLLGHSIHSRPQQWPPHSVQASSARPSVRPRPSDHNSSHEPSDPPSLHLSHSNERPSRPAASELFSHLCRRPSRALSMMPHVCPSRSRAMEATIGRLRGTYTTGQKPWEEMLEWGADMSYAESSQQP